MKWIIVALIIFLIGCSWINPYVDDDEGIDPNGTCQKNCAIKAKRNDCVYDIDFNVGNETCKCTLRCDDARFK